jgi:ascorbate-specific PTS system EIIC-type component UlaA
MNVYLTICVSFHFSLADSLSYTSIIYVALIVVFIIIIVVDRWTNSNAQVISHR